MTLRQNPVGGMLSLTVLHTLDGKDARSRRNCHGDNCRRSLRRRAC